MNKKNTINRIKVIILKVLEYLDTSPNYLPLACDLAFMEKIRSILSKYALYSESAMMDSSYNGFGLLEIEYIGHPDGLEICQLVIGKTIYDYLKTQYLGFAQVKYEARKIGDRHYIIRAYYSFNKKTAKAITDYYKTISTYKKEEMLKHVELIDETLEREMERWKIE